jgi:signal transduction histidine kinase
MISLATSGGGRLLVARLVAGAALLAVALGAVAAVTGRGAGLVPEGRDWVIALLCVPLGLRVVGHAPRHACGWLLLAAGGCAAGTVGASVWGGGVAAWVRDWLWWPSFGVLLLVALLFPLGEPITRRWRWLVWLLVGSTVAGCAALAVISLRTPGVLFAGSAAGPRPGWEFRVLGVALVGLLVGAGCTVAALVVRVRRTARAERGPLLWVTGNAALLLTALVLDLVGGLPVVWWGATLAVPLATTVAVVRYGLYDIGLLVHRSLLYGLLTIAVLVVYAAAVAFVVRFAPAVAAPAAAGATVVALLPLRQAVQALLQRLLYGHRTQPYHLVTSLSRQVNLADTPDRVLAAAVTAVGAGLRLPYVSIQLEDRSRPVATHGRRRSWPVTTLPLIHRGRPIGELLLQQRAPDEPWSAHEQELLRDLAEHLGPPAAAAGLAHELQDARERLVGAREESLRRIQRELHDGIGPTLTGARMIARAARAGRPDAAGLLDDLDASLADATTELRHVIDGLRPSALDRGLPAALAALQRRHRAGDLQLTLTLSGDLARLPAAIEVAAYRVIDEAVANVVQHAGSATARVTVARAAGHLHLAVDDDGVGGAGVRPGGVGLASMRERCQELGGRLEIRPKARGTRVTAAIPLG